jgi:hypothetical protein
MGFERNIVRVACGSLLLLAGTASVGAPEPLIITKLPEQELLVTRSAAAEQRPSIDEAMDRFGQAIGDALEAEQDAIQRACRSAERPKAGTAAAYEWRARCSYQRY